MKTTLLSTSEQDIEKAGAIIRGGGLVAFPTETVYGLGANALDERREPFYDSIPMDRSGCLCKRCPSSAMKN